MNAEGGDTMFLNIGPHHPATHGVLHIETVLDGEQVAAVNPDVGYLHRCEEQMCQQSTYRYQIMPYPDRWDYGPGGIINEWSYARAAEDLADIDVPEYAQILRTMGSEMCRITCHLLATGTFALDIYGDFTAIFMYAMQDREKMQNLLEDLTGQRMMFNYLRLGGVVWDIPEPREEYFEKVRDVLDEMPERLEEYHDLITSNEIFQSRCIDTGSLDPETAKDYGVTGPVARGSGIDYDLRRDDPTATTTSSTGTWSPRTAATTTRGCSFASARSRSPHASSSSASTCLRTGPRTSETSSRTFRAR